MSYGLVSGGTHRQTRTMAGFGLVMTNPHTYSQPHSIAGHVPLGKNVGHTTSRIAPRLSTRPGIRAHGTDGH